MSLSWPKEDFVEEHVAVHSGSVLSSKSRLVQGSIQDLLTSGTREALVADASFSSLAGSLQSLPRILIAHI